MLLDFNLAQDWTLSDEGRPVVDPGGTLAYMAPERLQAIALNKGPAAAATLDRSIPAHDGAAGPADPHRVDLYALGMVLLEALTLQAPPPTAGDNGALVRMKTELRDLAAAFAAFRQRGAPEVIQAAQVRGARPISPALRAILQRCLAAQPEDRYRRASELAEDLDRWRTDRPLAYASEPFWTHTLPRSMRKKKRVLATAALALMVTVLTTFVVMVKSRSTRQSMALDKLARKWDDADSRAFHLQRPGLVRPQYPDDPQALAAAVSALKDYDVFGDANWKHRDAIQTLPVQDREDVELWLMEQALRYCRALEQRASSPGDWVLALTIVDHVNHHPKTRVFDALRRHLIDKLRPSGLLSGRPENMYTALPKGEGESSETSRRGPELPWLESFLVGVTSELDDQDGAWRPDVGQYDSSNGYMSMGRADHSASRKALDHYHQVLTLRPDSFWARYRAAVLCFQLERWPEAAVHLDRCQQRRPNNPMIPALLASCLCELGRYDEALRQCNRALELAPDHAEYFRSRAFIRAASGQVEGLESDLERFELLNRLLSRTIFRVPVAQGPSDIRASAGSHSHDGLERGDDPLLTAHPIDPLIGPQDIDPDDLDTRAALAAAIYKAGGLAIAATELDKILMLDPNQLRARIAHMTQELELNHFSAARDDLDVVMSHGELREYLCSGSKNSTPLVRAAQQFATRGLTEEAMRIADKLVRSGFELGLSRGRFHYTRAVVMSVAARTDSANLPGAARQLMYAFQAHPRFKEWYHQDKLFDPVRGQIDAMLEQLPDLPSRF
jgi:tetratricopeptide (TPR) repeat protein